MAFGAETTADEVLAGVDLTGKTAAVTGATAGIGLETARALAARGAQVVITARDQAKADEALKTLREAVPNARFDSAVMELGSLKSVRACATDLLARYPKVDLLINNAGVMNTPFGRTDDGFETQFGVDHLGPFLFTNLMLPAVVAAAPSRIVMLSSAAHLRSDILWDDVNWETQPYDKFLAYAQSKTANMLFALSLDRRLAGKGVRAYGVHPGAVSTSLGRYMTKEDREMMMRNRPAAAPAAQAAAKPAAPAFFLKNIPQGASSTVWAATAPELADRGGLYIQDCQVAGPHTAEHPGVRAYALDPASADRLWALSEKMVGQNFPA